MDTHMKQTKITRDSLMTLETYAKARPEFRKRVIEHKKLRTLALGEHVTLIFEDELTIRYQIQEMLRIEKIFEEEGILHELESYTPLVPDRFQGERAQGERHGDRFERRDDRAPRSFDKPQHAPRAQAHAGGNDRFDRAPRRPKLVGGGFKPHAPKRRG